MKSTAIHEITHAAESSATGNKMAKLQRQFIERRCKGEQLKHIAGSIDKNGEYEWAYEDDFADHYMGRHYWLTGNLKGKMGDVVVYPGDHPNYEVMTMGMEGVMYGTRETKKDADYTQFVLGVLAGH